MIVPPLSPPIVTALSSKPGISAVAPVDQPAGTTRPMPFADAGTVACWVAAGVAVVVATGSMGSSPPPLRAIAAITPTVATPPTTAAGTTQPGRPESPDFWRGAF